MLLKLLLNFYLSMLSLNYFSWSCYFFCAFRFTKLNLNIYFERLLQAKTKFMQKKPSYQVTRYASIGLSLTLSNLKFLETQYLSDFDPSSGTKLVYILQNSICFQKCLVRRLNSKKEFEFGFYGYIFF